MHNRPALWLILGLFLASALFLKTDSPAFADPAATVYPESGGLVPFHGLRDSGVTIYPNNIDASQTSVPISDPARLKVGQIVETQDANREIMGITALHTSTMDVSRGQLGTSPASHSNHTVLYSDFTAVKVMASGVGYRPTGATLSAAVDAGTLDTGLSGAFLAQSIGKTETTIKVTDASLLTDATVVRIDGTAYVSVANKDFLGSTHRSVMCPSNTLAGDSILFGCATLGATPDGPTGSGILAEVRLRAEHLGTISLDLQNVTLTDIRGGPPPYGAPFSIDEVLGGTVTVVSGSPPPPSPPSPNCGGTGVKVCVLPSSQNVGLGNEFTAYIAVQNVWKEYGYGLGSYQFTLKWAPATEQMSIQSVLRGYLADNGTGWDRGAKLSASIGETATELPFDDVSQLQAGYTALMGSEEMLILAVSTSPSPSITVIRGYHGTTPTTHPLDASIWAGPERITVTRASLPAPHSAGADFRDNLRLLRVSDHTFLHASALQIDSERFKVMEIPSRTLRNTGLTLSSGVNETQTALALSGSGSVEKGWILQVDSELMPVTVGGSSSVTVVRGFFGSQASSHSAGTPIKAVFPESNTVRTSRGFQGTPIASHAAGAPITDVDGLGDYVFTMSSPGVPAIIGFVWADNSTFLGQTGRTVQCNPPSFGGGNVSFQCNTTGALPLGNTGSGTLATVNVTGKQLLAGAPPQTLNLSGVTLHDVSGDTLSVTLNAGSVAVVGCPDIDNPLAVPPVHKDGIVDFGKDVLDIAKATLIAGYPIVDAHDVNRNGIVRGDFGGDALNAARIALLKVGMLRCPL
jgi:hypothetical protein